MGLEIVLLLATLFLSQIFLNPEFTVLHDLSLFMDRGPEIWVAKNKCPPDEVAKNKCPPGIFFQKKCFSLIFARNAWKNGFCRLFQNFSR